MFRTDKHNNPTAFTTQIASLAGLVANKDYETGDPFTVTESGKSVTYYTAKLLGDPIDITITVIDKIGFYTKWGGIRWIYIGIPQWLWMKLDKPDQIKIIGFMYGHEGGTELKHLFA